MIEPEEALRLALDTLEPLRSSLVVVGGTAHRLFPRHDLANSLAFELLTTEDVDLATPLDLVWNDDSSTPLERLVEAGFEEEIGGATYATHRYRLRGRNAPYLQFLAPRTGSGITRSGARQHSFQISGVTAERLPHVDILLHAPWSLALSSEGGLARVVNPVAFLVQKGLILDDRPPEKRGKDVLYCYDTLTLFAENLETLAARTLESVPRLSPRARAKLRRNFSNHCLRTSDATIEAGLIAREQRPRPPEASLIAAACRSGLSTILEPLGLTLD